MATHSHIGWETVPGTEASQILQNLSTATRLHPPEGIFSDGSLRGKACYSPYTYLYPTVKLLSSHIPHTLIGDGLCLGLKIVTYRSCDISHTTPTQSMQDMCRFMNNACSLLCNGMALKVDLFLI